MRRPSLAVVLAALAVASGLAPVAPARGDDPAPTVVVVETPQGRPVEGAWLVPAERVGRRFLVDDDPPLPDAPRSDAWGRLEVPAPAEAWAATARGFGCTPVAWATPSARGRLVLLGAGSPRAVVVEGASGTPAEGGFVVVRGAQREAAGVDLRARVQPGGHATCSRLPWSPNLRWLAPDGSEHDMLPVGATRLRVAGDGTGSIAARVLDAEGGRAPADALPVLLRRLGAAVDLAVPMDDPAADATVAAVVLPGPDGRCAAAGLAPGAYEAHLAARSPWAWDGEAPRIEVEAGVRWRGPTWWVRRRGAIAGKVEDARTRAPVAQPRVTVLAPRGAAPLAGASRHNGGVALAGDGTFVADGVAPDDGYRLLVEAEGYAPAVVGPLRVRSGVRAPAGRVLLFRPWGVSVRVLGPEEEPVEDASVVVVPADRPAARDDDPANRAFVRSARTDATGRAVLAEAADGDAIVRVEAEGFVAAAEVVVGRPAGSVAEHTVRLARTQSIEGRVEWLDAARPALVVRARPRSGGPERTATPGPDGDFVLRGLAPSATDVEAVAVGSRFPFVLARREGVVPGSGEAVVLPVGAPRRVSGTVEDPEPGEPTAVVRLEALRYDPDRDDLRAEVVAEVRLSAATGGALPFAFDGVPEGSYALRAVQGSRDSGPVPVEVVAEEEGGIALRLGGLGEVAGEVWDAVRMRPALGARVSLRRLEGSFPSPGAAADAAWQRADDRGRFRFRGVSEGLWRVEAVEAGLAGARTEVRLAEGEAAWAGTLQVSAGGRIEGRVADASRGPVAGLPVVVERWPEAEPVERPATGEDGVFATGPLPEGRYRLRAAPDLVAGGAVEAEVEVVEGETTRVEWTATGLGRIEGFVHRRGTPVPGAGVELAAGGLDGVGGVVLRRVSDAYGRFAWDGLPEGVYELRILDGVVHSGETLRLRRGDRVARDVELGEGRIAGRVVADRDRPVAGAEIVAVPWAAGRDPDAERGRVRTGPDGRFTMPGLPVGAYRLLVTPPGRATRVVPQVQADLAGHEFPVEVRVSEGAVLELAVADPGGRGVGAAEVWVEDLEGVPLHAQPFATTQGGRLRVEGLSEGEAVVLVHARGYGRPAPLRVRLREGTSTQARVGLRAGGGLRLRVEAGRDPAPGAGVRVLREPGGTPVVHRGRGRGSRREGWVTGRSGSVVVEDLDEGAYTVVVTGGRAGGEVRVPVRVRAGRVEEVRAVLP